MSAEPPRSLPRPLRAVSFDCWQTLLVERDWHLAHARRIEALVETLRHEGRPVGENEARAAFDTAWALHMEEWTGGVATGARQIAQRSLALLDCVPGGPALAELVELWEEASHSDHVEAVAGAAETLRALARAGIPRVLVCDTGLTPGRVVRRHLAARGLLPHLDVCIFSDEVGVPKPDPRTFRAALQPLGVATAAAAHVGDLRRTDVAGARGVGMFAVRLRAVHDDPSPLPDADAVVDSYADLRGLLGLDPT